MRRLLHLTCASMLLAGCFLDRSPFAGGDGPPVGMDASPPVGVDASTREDSGAEDAAAPVDAQRAEDAFVPVDACVPARELCDGLDNDCDPTTPDGSADPRVGMPCDGEDADECEDGVYECRGGTHVCVEDASTTKVETCNGQDDDCDGRIDEDADCPCNHRLDEDGHGYLFCARGSRQREEARLFCAERGYRLVIIGDEAEQRWLHARAQEVAFDEAWWIGAIQTTEGDFVWLDGSTLEGSFTNWRPDEPNNADGREQCVELLSDHPGRTGIPGGWNDVRCDRNRRFICEAAPTR